MTNISLKEEFRGYLDWKSIASIFTAAATLKSQLSVSFDSEPVFLAHCSMDWL